MYSETLEFTFEDLDAEEQLKLTLQIVEGVNYISYKLNSSKKSVITAWNPLSFEKIKQKALNLKESGKIIIHSPKI